MARRFLRLRRFLAKKILHTDDPPHAIALGATIGMIVAWLPLPGMQTVTAIAIAAMLRANKAICVPMVWMSNPLTVGPVYYGFFLLGRLFMPGRASADSQRVSELVESLKGGSLLDPQAWRDALTVFLSVSTEFSIGLLIASIPLGLATYGSARWAVSALRERHRSRELRRTLLHQPPVADTALSH